jgi:NAD(P)-dependent dehydrogenase (short-subunit alcohol dehydrogenase family)
MSKVWLITGCSSGLGRSLTLAALKSGHQVIATSRNPSKTPDLVAEVQSLGGQWKSLDVSDPNNGNVVDEVIKEFGRIDVLVNNAGVALIGAFEEIR